VDRLGNRSNLGNRVVSSLPPAVKTRLVKGMVQETI